MRSARGSLAVAMAALMALAACGGDRVPELMNLRSETNGPDEFSILPPKPLEMPESLTDLPEPTPGGENLTDPHPLDDAAIALGGKARAAGGIPAGDAALANYAARKGATAGIRQTLAAEDLDWRRRNDGRLLERIFNTNVYFKAYRKQSLDQQTELQRWRAAGARTSSAPPAKKGEQ